MLEILGSLVCGAIIATAAVCSGTMRPGQASMTVGAGLIGVLALSLAPYLGAPQDQVRTLLAGQGLIGLWFFLALLAALIYLSVQVLHDVTPEELLPALRRWENGAVALGGLTLILGLATTRLTLAA